MNIFEYMQEEELDLERKLAELVRNFSKRTREQVFDEVKFIYDALRGHCQKQKSLLTDKLKMRKNGEADVHETQVLREKVLEDLNTLVMIHVDEPGYDAYLAQLLERTKQYYAASRKLYEKVQQKLSKEDIDAIDANLRQLIHSDVGFNTIQSVKS